MAQRQRLPRPILISLPRRRMVSPAVLVAASILDFRPRLGNRCSDFDAAAKNRPPAAWLFECRQGQGATKAA